MSPFDEQTPDSHAVDRALERLRQTLPLAARLQAQAPLNRDAYRLIQSGFARHGRPPVWAELARRLDRPMDGVGRALASADLIVCDAHGEVEGAYPFTLAPTSHVLRYGGVITRAMCAVDALAVAPVLGLDVTITSRCHVSDRPITVVQHGARLHRPDSDCAVVVGLVWQPPGSCAARSLCREIVFLHDTGLARDWQAEAPAERTVLALREAIELGRRFFQPLLSAP